HLTAKKEMGAQLIQDDPQKVQAACEEFVQRYNWVRPHDSLDGQVPGSRYAPFAKRRPDKLPEHHIPEGAVSRKVLENGYFHFHGLTYRMGRGMAGHRILIQEDEQGLRTFFQGFPLPYLFQL